MIKQGLRQSVKDGKEYNFGAIFGYAKLDDIPKVFRIGPVVSMKEQKDSDFCVGMGFSTASEYQEEVELSPEWFFAKCKELTGKVDEWGTDIKTGGKVACSSGFIEQKDAPFSLQNKDRDFLADINNWPDLNAQGLIHKKSNYFFVEKSYGYDLFDAMRAAIWKFKDEKRTLVTGANWKSSWLGNGYISEDYPDEQGFGHCFVIVGWNEYGLVAQVTGDGVIGDQGFFYFPRSVVNKEFVFDTIMLKDLPQNLTHEDAILLSKQARSNWFIALLHSIFSFFFHK